MLAKKAYSASEEVEHLKSSSKKQLSQVESELQAAQSQVLKIKAESESEKKAEQKELEKLTTKLDT